MAACPACGDSGKRRHYAGTASEYTAEPKVAFCNGGWFCAKEPHLHRNCETCKHEFLTKTKTDMTPKSTGGEISLK